MNSKGQRRGTASELADAIGARTAGVCVVGLGYVGLPLALRVAQAGFHTTGLDSDAALVATLRQGRSPLLGICGEDIGTAVANDRFHVTSDSSCLADADVLLICVPTPLKDGSPNLEFIDKVGHAVADNLRIGQLVVLESTTYPGTTEEFLRGILESSGLKAGADFYLGFSPERIDPGNQEFHLQNVPKIVGGFDPQSAELMKAFYGTLVDRVVPVSSARAAEMAKLLENTYRHVNIALVNEIAILCHDLGIDVWEVIDAASTKPFGFQAFYPGPGWGGHCIPVDPAFLSWRVRQMGSTARFVDLAREFNQRMPAYIVQRVGEALNELNCSVKGSSILILGVAYKPEVSDVRESPALEIIERLINAGAIVRFHDPYVSSVKLKGGVMMREDLVPDVLRSADLVLLHTDHRAYDREWLSSHSRLIFDTRNFFHGVEGRIVTL